MKWLKTLIIFDKGELVSGKDWEDIHASCRRSIESIKHPLGSKKLTLRKKVCVIDERGKPRWKRNGVVYLKASFLEHITKKEKWKKESPLVLPKGRIRAVLKEYPSLKEFADEKEILGDFDFLTSRGHFKVGLEWETGNISSSHRSMNKLVIALSSGVIQIGVLIMPSRLLYEHLTDRIGNFEELGGYLDFWAKSACTVTHGLLAVIVVEHDALTDSDKIPYLKMGTDGNAEKS